MVLIDTSAWIEFFRRGGNQDVADRVERLLDWDQAAICGIIELELLQGLRFREQRKLQSLFEALHYIHLARIDYIEAGDRLRDLRRQGITVPSSDGVIATAAIRRGIPLLSTDKHFSHFKELAH